MRTSTPPFLKTLFISTFILFSFLSTAQNRSYWDIQLNAGTSLFFGDIKQYNIAPVSNYENEWRMGFGLQAGRQLSYVFGLRGQFLYGKLAGTRREWKRYFNADYYETNLNATMNLNNLFGKNKRSDRFFNTYLIVGIGLTQYNSTVYELGTDKILHQVGHGNGSGIKGRSLEGILTGGLGVDFRINDHFRINLESVNRALNSDNLDHWEKGFKYDIYNYTSIGVSYRFGLKNKQSKSSIKADYYPTDNESIPSMEEENKNLDTLSIEENVEPLMPPEPDSVEAKVIEIEPPIIEEEDTVIIEPVVVPKPEKEYRIQIAARYGKPLSILQLSEKYNIPADEIQESMYHGYYIYTVGSYNTYEEAKEARKRVIYQNGVPGAFIVAFKNGHRVDLKEITQPQPSGMKDLEYRIQISARYGKPLSLSALSRKYNLPKERIREDIHNGFYIYTVGSFNTYEEAKEYKYQLIDNNGIQGAFVVAFKEGVRLDSIPLNHE